MDITLVLAVYNKLDLTKQCYAQIRKLYPDVKISISSGGSTDGTKEWLESLTDPNLLYAHTNEKTVFSKNYNTAIKLATTDKIVLIHNDMVLGDGFLENIDKNLIPNVVLSYTTVEPPIFTAHDRPGKVIRNFGYGFQDFNYDKFTEYVSLNNKISNITPGAVFFMAGYKSMFEDVGFFDDFSFVPAFAEDDDFLIRAKLKGYDLKTISSAITYHFVSQTSRFSDEFKSDRALYEVNSNRNFIRKWGMPIHVFNQLFYWELPDFKYSKNILGLVINDSKWIPLLEPFFDKIMTSGNIDEYLKSEIPNTNYNISQKFIETVTPSATIELIGDLTENDFDVIQKLQLIVSQYTRGKYEFENLIITIH